MSDTAFGLPSPSARAVRARTGRTLAVRLLAPVALAACVIGLWQLWVAVGNVDPAILPPPSDVFRQIAKAFDQLFPAAWITVQTILTGLGIASGCGLLLALLIAAFRPLELSIYPLLIASQVVPKIAIAPVIFVIVGLNQNARLIIVVLLSFFPIVISSVVGLRSIDPTRIYLARSLGANVFQQFWRFRIPHALPDVFSGLKLGVTRAVGAAIIAEFISTGTGLGRSILLATFQQRPDIALAGVAYMVVIGVFFFFALGWLERIAIPWHASVRNTRR
jgi:NitT/TauT family transport system permease protein